MKQFDIMWATLPAPIGRRPVLLLTRTAAYAYLNKVLIAEVKSLQRSGAFRRRFLLERAKGSLEPRPLISITFMSSRRPHLAGGSAPFQRRGRWKSNALLAMRWIGPNLKCSDWVCTQQVSAADGVVHGCAQNRRAMLVPRFYNVNRMRDTRESGEWA